MSNSAKWLETPYIYTKLIQQNFTTLVGPSLTNGLYPSSIRSDGDSDFFARRVSGVFNFQDADGRFFYSGLDSNTLATRVLPPGAMIEKLYPLGTDIPYQLFVAANLLLGGDVNSMVFPGVNTAFVNLIATKFQGAKRYKGVPDRTPNYKFYEKDYTYTFSFNLNWLYLVGPTYTNFVVENYRTFTQRILDYDFELRSISVDADYKSSSANNPVNRYMMRIYDANNYALMNDFVGYQFLSQVGGYNQAAAPPIGGMLVFNPNGFPAPGVVYPKGSTIQFDIQSLCDTGSGGTGVQEIQFRGVRRIPC